MKEKIRIAVLTEIKVEELLNKLMFNEEIPVSIDYINKKTNEEKRLYVSKKGFMECIKNKEFNLDDKIKYWKVEEVNKENVIFTPTPYLVEKVKE